MPSLELLLDPEAERALRAEWVSLAGAGLPSQARHPGESTRPHITLLYSSERLRPYRLVGLPLEVTAASPVVFGSARHGFLLARLVRPSLRLLELHRTLHREVGDLPGIDPLTRPDAWTAHITLARKLSPAQLATALTVIEPAHAIEAKAVSGRMWESATKTATALPLA